MAIKYLKIQCLNDSLTFDSEKSYLSAYSTTDEHNEHELITKLQEMVHDNKINIESQFFKINSTYHKMNFPSETDANEIQTMMENISSFSIVDVSEIASTDYDSYTSSGAVVSEAFEQYTSEETLLIKNS